MTEVQSGQLLVAKDEKCTYIFSLPALQMGISTF